jgi:hypothetical protein
MKLAKSSRHSKITGDFGESIVLYLLSRHGFECARVDHTGIDLIARRPNLAFGNAGCSTSRKYFIQISSNRTKFSSSTEQSVSLKKEEDRNAW